MKAIHSSKKLLTFFDYSINRPSLRQLANSTNFGGLAASATSFWGLGQIYDNAHRVYLRLRHGQQLKGPQGTKLIQWSLYLKNI